MIFKGRVEDKLRILKARNGQKIPKHRRYYDEEYEVALIMYYEEISYEEALKKFHDYKYGTD